MISKKKSVEQSVINGVLVFLLIRKLPDETGFVSIITAINASIKQHILRQQNSFLQLLLSKLKLDFNPSKWKF